jgi:hypothetical protein
MTTEKFEFPADITRRERWVFEKYAGGVTMGEFVALLQNGGESKVTTQMEAALLLVAVRRVRPSATIDDVLDSDWELLPPADDGEAKGESPLPPPAAVES